MANALVPMPAEEAPEAAKPVRKAVQVEALVDVVNIAEHLDGERLARIGDDVVREYEIDRDSMKEWLAKMDTAIKLAKLVKEDKAYPFDKASNVKYPLVTTAALQFNAKAYPAIVSADEAVKVRIYGNDPNGQKAARSERIAQHMSYDLDCNVPEWEESTDNLLTILPIMGQVYRKWRWDETKKRKRCRLILPGRFIVNDHIEHLEDAPRMTEEIPLYPGEIQTRRMSGEWLDIEYREENADDPYAPEDFLEQHRTLDLDEDGYEEPYIVTVHKRSRKVARIVADFEAEDIHRSDKVVDKETGQGRIMSINRGTYFVDYKFLPSLDGGFHGTGLGLLLGDITEAINTTINMMLDAGHMQALGGGFIGSDFRIKGGSSRFRPGEWKTPGASGATIKDSIVPMTWPGPSPVLFELLGLLIEAGKEVASIKDVITGETGNKTMPVGTTLALIEQGMAQFTAAYKRIFRALRFEFRLVAKLNRKHVSFEEYNKFLDDGQMVPGGPPGPDGQPTPVWQPIPHDPARDYDLSDMDIEPVADPTSVTRMQEMGKAQFLQGMAEQGLVNPQVASRRILEAANIPDTEELMPQPDPMQQAMVQAEIAEKQAKAQASTADAATKASEAETKKLEARIKLMEAQQKPAELQMQLQDAELKSKETNARIALMAAQIEKIHAEIAVVPQEMAMKQAESEQGMALKAHESELGMSLKAKESAAKLAQSEQMAQLEMQHAMSKNEIDLQGAQVDQLRKEEMHQQKLGFAKEDQERQARAFEEDRKAKAERDEQDHAEDRKIAIARDEADHKEDRAEGKKPKRKRTRVTKYTDDGRIAEFETSED